MKRQTGIGILFPSAKRAVGDLEAVGFHYEGPAKILGQKVTLCGTSTACESRFTIKVRSISRMSDVCAPQQ